VSFSEAFKRGRGSLFLLGEPGVDITTERGDV
jgi:hypothetical protein